MAEQAIPLRRTLLANAVVLAPSWGALVILYGVGELNGRATLIAMAGIAVLTGLLVQRYLGTLARFARFVGELSDEREPVMPRLSFAPATEELATAAATLSTFSAVTRDASETAWASLAAELALLSNSLEPDCRWVETAFNAVMTPPTLLRKSSPMRTISCAWRFCNSSK